MTRLIARFIIIVERVDRCVLRWLIDTFTNKEAHTKMEIKSISGRGSSTLNFYSNRAKRFFYILLVTLFYQA